MLTKPAYLSTGAGTHLVFQNGLTASKEQIRGLLEGLKGVRLVSMDCPGHGETPIMPGYIPSFNQYADDLIRLMDDLNIDKCIFGGLSMGAGISLNIALRYPERVSGLILLRPAWLDQQRPENLRLIEQGAAMISRGDGEKLFRELPEFQKISINNPAASKSILGIFGIHQQQGLDRVISAMVNDCPFPSMEDLENIKVPCLLLANEDDPLHPYNFAENLAQYLPIVKLERITSRYKNQEAYRTQVNKEIARFINEKG